MPTNDMVSDMNAAIKSVCDKHGFYNHGLNVFLNGNELVFRFKTSNKQSGSISDEEILLLKELGIELDPRKSQLFNPNDNRNYKICGINYENENFPIIICCIETKEVFFCDLDKLRNMDIKNEG